MSASRASNAVDAAAIAVSGLPAAVVFLAFVGLGLHRNASTPVIVLTACGLVWGPPLIAALFQPERRGLAFAAVSLVWSTALFLGLPVYFPQERGEAVASGLGALYHGDDWDQLARDVASRLPAEPAVSQPPPDEAVAVVDGPPPPPLDLADDQIALPFEGEGRRLSVPVVFEHNGRTVETWMLLDTGATYTTLPRRVLYELGIEPTDSSPVLTLHTANGERQAAVAVADRVWLGNLPLDGVAIAECEACATGDTEGLLGLNVAGSYNLTIDADRQEAIFTRRSERQQRLDIRPFVQVGARFSRLPAGRVDVTLTVKNNGPRHLDRIVGELSCDSGTWQVTATDIGPGEEAEVTQRLPVHDRCEGYRVGLADGAW